MSINVIAFGCTGNVGDGLIDVLKNYPKVDLTIFTRDQKRAHKKYGDVVSYIQGSVSDEKQVQSAMQGKDRVVWNNGQYECTIYEQGGADLSIIPRCASACSSVQHIVRVSTCTEMMTFKVHDYGRVHARAEDILYTTPGVEVTVLRPYVFMSNFTEFWADSIRSSNTIAWGSDDVVLNFIHNHDVADAIFTILSSPVEDHARTTYELSGFDEMSLPSAADLLSEIIGHKITYTKLSFPELHKRYKSFGLDNATAVYLATIGRAYQTCFAPSTPRGKGSDLEIITGNRPRKLRDFFESNKSAFVTKSAL